MMTNLFASFRSSGMLERAMVVLGLCFFLGTFLGCSDPVDTTPGDNPDVGIDIGSDDDALDDTGPDEDVRPEVDVPDPDPDSDVGLPDIVDPPDTGDDDTGDVVIEPDTDGPVVLGIQDISPNRGPLFGGTPFVIRGTGFTEQTSVFFGSRLAHVDLVEGRLVGQTPEGPAVGPVTLKILDPEMGQDSLVGGFTYTAPLEISSIFPTRVPTSGGVEVTIEGRGFTNDTYFSFGGVSGQRHTLVDATQMLVIVPPREAGRVDVRATNPEATSLLPGAITYYDTLRLDHIRPAQGDVAGGEAVTLTGAGLTTDMSVSFGNASATVTSAGADG
ncbi:MAG: IPT/TIG domain-containing protein, partial [Bradymonadaceae bacterium]